MKNEIANAEVTMTTREIAELTGKRHDNVVRDFKAMCEQLNVNASGFAHIYFDNQNRQQIEYKLDKEMTLCLVTGYDVRFRMAVLKDPDISKNVFSLLRDEFNKLPSVVYLYLLAKEDELVTGYGITINIPGRHTTHKKNLKKAGWKILKYWASAKHEGKDIKACEATLDEIRHVRRGINVDGFKTESIYGNHFDKFQQQIIDMLK